nr:aminoacyl-tRNA hydrolase [Diaphorobacter aerolatus]
MIKLFVGLGNPGPEYEATRHNAGFWWIDEFARDLKVNLVPERGYFGLMARANVSGNTIWLLEPQTFMNVSGKSVAALARFFKIAPRKFWWCMTNSTFPRPGQTQTRRQPRRPQRPARYTRPARLIRLLAPARRHRSPGVKSEVVNWVLKKPSPDQRKLIDDSIIHSLKSWPAMVEGDMEKATMQVHTNKPQRPKPPRPTAPDAA